MSFKEDGFYLVIVVICLSVCTISVCDPAVAKAKAKLTAQCKEPLYNAMPENATLALPTVATLMMIERDCSRRREFYGYLAWTIQMLNQSMAQAKNEGYLTLQMLKSYWLVTGNFLEFFAQYGETKPSDEDRILFDRLPLLANDPGSTMLNFNSQKGRIEILRACGGEMTDFLWFDNRLFVYFLPRAKEECAGSPQGPPQAPDSPPTPQDPNEGTL